VLWFTGQNGIYGRLDPKTGAIAIFDAPRGTGPYGITTTPDGQIFFASLAGNYLGQIDLETGAVTVLEPPVPRQGARRVWSDSAADCGSPAGTGRSLRASTGICRISVASHRGVCTPANTLGSHSTNRILSNLQAGGQSVGGLFIRKVPVVNPTSRIRPCVLRFSQSK
jgi:hypothetical protein